MRFSLFFAIGWNIFGLGLIVDWAKDDDGFELQLGPLNIWAASGWGMMISLLGRTIWQTK